MSVAQDDELFKTGKVFSAPNEELDGILSRLAAEWNTPNLQAMILTRVSIINTIKQQRHIDKIEGRNQIFTWIIISLSAAAILAQILPLILSGFCKK